MKEFTVTENHIKLVQHLSIDNYDNRVSINQKRPYGNSDILYDILEITEIKPVLVKYDEKIYSEEQEKEAWKIHNEIHIILQILLDNLNIKPATYLFQNGSWSLF